MKKIAPSLVVLVAALTLSSSSNAYAVCDGCVVAAVQEGAQQLSAELTSIGSMLQLMLTEIDDDIGAIGAKESGSSVMAANTQRD
ncbi:MAG: hypothetical protein RXR20_25285, partial [Paraburkholderia sp.]